jgi:hypothetical protein
MTVSEDCAAGPIAVETALPAMATHASRSSSSFGAFCRIGVPIALWMVFANIASHHHEKGGRLDATLREAVEAELASRRCPGVRLDPASFREFARERGINHADLYQKRSLRLQKIAAHLERSLRTDPASGCQRMLDLYGETGSAPHLLTRT